MVSRSFVVVFGFCVVERENVEEKNKSEEGKRKDTQTVYTVCYRQATPPCKCVPPLGRYPVREVVALVVVVFWSRFLGANVRCKFIR